METRVYRPSWGFRAFSIAVGTVCILSALGIMTAPLFARWSNVPYPWQLALYGLFFVVMGIATLVAILTYRVELYSDAIEVRGGLWSNSRCLVRECIAAKEMPFVPYVKTYHLYAADLERRKLTVYVMFQEDAHFREWMDGIPVASDQFLNARFKARLRRLVRRVIGQA